jgi:hypothetical protein
MPEGTGSGSRSGPTTAGPDFGEQQEHERTTPYHTSSSGVSQAGAEDHFQNRSKSRFNSMYV